MINFKKKMAAFKKDDGKPRKHPKLEEGWVRIVLPEIKGETVKATLFDFKDPKVGHRGLLWIPKSLYQRHWRPRFTPLPGDDKDDVLDIKEWFYKKEIEK